MRRSFTQLSCLTLVVFSSSVACSGAKADAVIGRPAAPTTGEGSIDVLHHAVGLSVQVDPPALSGRGEFRVRARRTLTAFTLDARALRVSEVADRSGPLRFRQEDDHLQIELPDPVAGGSEFTVTIAWQASTTGKMPRFSPGQVWAGYRASAWMPTVQDPSQRATLALRIAAPAPLAVAASGRRIGTAEAANGRREHSFVLERPTPPFLYAFAAGHFDEAELTVDDVKLKALGPIGSDLKGALATTAPIYRFLRSRAGIPLPTSEYLQVFVHGDDTAQEAAGLALLAEGALVDVQKDPTEDWIFSHELAHQWFGWSTPCADFSDFWLNEGFATFLVAAVKEQRWGRGAYEREVELWHQRSAKVHAEGRDAPISLSPPGIALESPPSESTMQPRGITYFRGALALHKLRGELGETAFWNGVRHYVKDRAGKSARTEDLRAAFEASSGRNLRDFFEKWIYQSAPDL